MKGYLLYDEIDELLPADYRDGTELDDILSEIARNGLEVLESPKAEHHEESNQDGEFFDEKELQELSEQSGDTGELRSYLREVQATPRLTHEKEIELSKRIRDGEDAEKQLVGVNLRLVVRASRSYRNRGLGLLDLLQEGNIGLMLAAKKFDYTRGYQFSTYATWWIRRAIRRSL
jgi:RNA polymerase primary sigma factor